MTREKGNTKQISGGVKLGFASILCVVLCLLFPVAAPLFFSLFIGIAIRESGLMHVQNFIEGPLLYGSTFFLGMLLGILCEAHLILNPKILMLLVLGIVALLLSGVGGIMGGYFLYFVKKGNYNPFAKDYIIKGFDDRIKNMLLLMMAETCREFEKLPIIKYADILRNILYSGVWCRFESISRKRREEREKEDV